MKEEEEMNKENTCPSCGAEVSGGLKGCDDIFQEVIAREFGDFRYGRVHRLTVDVYSAQHPVRYMKKFVSQGAHLTGLCWVFEYEGGHSIGKMLKKWYDRKPNKQKITEPEFKGSMTIVDIINAENPEEHIELVRKWGMEIWEAYSDHHDTIRSWVKEAIGE